MHLKKEKKTLPFAGRDAYDLNDLNCFYSMKMVRYEKSNKMLAKENGEWWYISGADVHDHKCN